MYTYYENVDKYLTQSLNKKLDLKLEGSTAWDAALEDEKMVKEVRKTGNYNLIAEFIGIFGHLCKNWINAYKKHFPALDFYSVKKKATEVMNAKNVVYEKLKHLTYALDTAYIELVTSKNWEEKKYARWKIKSLYEKIENM